MRGLDTELDRLYRLRRHLTGALAEVNKQVEKLAPPSTTPAFRTDYRIALRPDDRDADPLGHGVLMDDIVVRNVSMFRAEQMGVDHWWVCCYLDDLDERICWSVRASARPKRLNWITTELPDDVTYEHEPRPVENSTP